MKIAILGTFTDYDLIANENRQGRAPGHPAASKFNTAYYLSQITGNEVHLITMNGEVNADQHLKRNGLHFHFLKSTPLYKKLPTLFESNTWKMHDFLNELQPDIVNGQHTLRDAYFAVTSTFPSVITPRGLVDDWYNVKKVKAPIIQKYWELLLEQRAIKRARNVICISPVVRQYFEEHHLSATLFDIENPVNINFFSTNGAHRNLKKFAFVGGLGERKRALDAVKAVISVNSAELDLIYHNEGSEAEAELKQYVRQQNAAGRIHFVGYIPNANLHSKLRESIGLILPTSAECAPMSISEAMASGLLILATNVDGIPYMINDEITGYLFESGDVSTLATKIETILRDPQRALEMANNAKIVAEQRWHPELITSQTMHAYRNIIREWDA
ncbi:glycosyltransferase family 4 protein [candidate division KSB1 bacterium]|nr:glycosyltransferase family 4 protein [candidate division KSB1 bacterium]